MKKASKATRLKPITKPKPEFEPARLVAKSQNQKEYIHSIQQNDITICYGPAGSGKSLCAIGVAVGLLRAGKIDKIIITRPVVESDEKIGFLPGSADEKLEPYLRQLFDSLKMFASYTEIATWKNTGVLEVAPIGFCRGRTFNGLVIVDEAQNCTLKQLIMLLTRIGVGGKMIIEGDLTQSDLLRNFQGGFLRCIEKLQNIDGIGIIEMESVDVVRHRLIPTIIERLS